MIVGGCIVLGQVSAHQLFGCAGEYVGVLQESASIRGTTNSQVLIRKVFGIRELFADEADSGRFCVEFMYLM